MADHATRQALLIAAVSTLIRACGSADTFGRGRWESTTAEGRARITVVVDFGDHHEGTHWDRQWAERAERVRENNARSRGAYEG